MMTPQWPLIAPVLWLAIIYFMHSSKNPIQAVIGWSLIFAPLFLAVGVAEVYAHVQEFLKYRSFRGAGSTPERSD